MDLVFTVASVVLQPTSLCNLNCRYCYLPQRAANLRMEPAVAARLADDLGDLLREWGHPVRLIWHGGEPLACGLKHFRTLVESFAELERERAVKHVVQTNATLIDEAWCEFFNEHDFHVGVSVDGPPWANALRVDRGGRESFDRAMRGAGYLKRAGVGFSAIAVVGDEMLERAEEVYEFFRELGCSSLGINIEEREGVNRREACDDARVSFFWRELFRAWRRDPRVEIREFRRVLSWMRRVCRTDGTDARPLEFDLIPTVGHDGGVVLLSPELLGARSVRYGDFVVGNVREESLRSMVGRWREIHYVRDFAEGVRACREECAHFSHCRGGQASNKFFELGTTGGTETAFCRNTRKRLVGAVLDSL